MEGLVKEFSTLLNKTYKDWVSLEKGVELCEDMINIISNMIIGYEKIVLKSELHNQLIKDVRGRLKKYSITMRLFLHVDIVIQTNKYCKQFLFEVLKKENKLEELPSIIISSASNTLH